MRLPEFERQCKRLKLTEDDIKDIEITLLSDPSIGDIIVGTGGVRKFRESLDYTNKGKRSGLRVIYIDFSFYEKIYLLTIYKKVETKSLSKAERNELKELVRILELELQRSKRK